MATDREEVLHTFTFGILGRKQDIKAVSNGELDKISGQEFKELKFGELRIHELKLDRLVDQKGEIKAEDPRYVVANTYLGFLNDSRTKLHFAHPPRDVRELVETKDEKDHILIATRVERVEGKLMEVVVGGARLTDNVEPENEHWISLWVVDPDKQRQGIGESVLRGIADWAYDNPAYDGRKRDHLHLGVNMEIDGSEAVVKLVKKVGFNPVQKKLVREMNYWQITYTDGHTELSPTNRDKILFGKKLELKEITRPDGTNYEEAQMEDGTKVEVIKKPTRRFGFSYVDYLEEKDKNHEVLVWQRKHPDEIELPKAS